MRRGLSSAAVWEASAGDRALPTTVRALGEWCRVSGPSFTVRTPPGDNLWIRRGEPLATLLEFSLP